MRLKQLALGIAAWSCCLQFHASQIIPFTIEELTSRADQIVYGKVTSKTCLRNPQGQIITRIEVDVFETWKGRAASKFVIVQAGGTLGEERVEAVGQPEYKPGETIIDFLRVNSRGEGASIGVCQGKFRVWSDATGKLHTANMFHGSTQLGSIHAADSARSTDLTVDALRTQVHEVIQ